MLQRIPILILTLLCVAAQLVAVPLALAAEVSDYQVKAAYIFNFVKFTEWPGEKSIDQQSKIDICVLGDSSIMDTASVFKGASSAKLTLSLVRESNVGNAKQHCHILFISESADDKLSDVLSGLRGSPVLTVSDGAGFAERGVMIGFVTSNNKVKLAVNKKAIESAGLRVDAQLLEIALKVIN